MNNKEQIIEALENKQQYGFIAGEADLQWRDIVGYVELSDGSVCHVASDMMEDSLNPLELDTDGDLRTDLAVSASNQTFTWFEETPTREGLKAAVDVYNNAIGTRQFEYNDTSVDDSVKIVDFDLI